jgi:hypothetical protein
MTDLCGTAEFKCPTPGCSRPARFIRAVVQENISPVTSIKPKFYLVECSKHGQKLVTVDGRPVLDSSCRARRTATS